MDFMRRFVVTIVVCLLVTCLSSVSPSEGASGGLKWHSHFEGLAMGKLENRNILVHFYASWCKFCEKMERETYGNSDVAAYMGDHFILAKVDTEKERELSAAYFVRGLPMVWFLGPSGEKITALPGYVPPEQFLLILEFIHTKAYENMTFKDFLDKKNR